MASKADQDNLLEAFVSRLRGVAGANLDSVVLYGSAADQDFHPEFSDLNVLCLLQRLDAPALLALRPAILWWQEQGQPRPAIFTLHELQCSADIFAIEFLDMKSRNRVLFGKDHLSTLDIPMALHRVELERELRTNVIRLRNHYISAGADPEKQLSAMADSLSSFATLFRHCLIAMGQGAEVPSGKRQVISALASTLGISATPFLSVLDVREGKSKLSELDVATTFNGYLENATRVADEIDRRMA